MPFCGQWHQEQRVWAALMGRHTWVTLVASSSYAAGFSMSIPYISMFAYFWGGGGGECCNGLMSISHRIRLLEQVDGATAPCQMDLVGSLPPVGDCPPLSASCIPSFPCVDYHNHLWPVVCLLDLLPHLLHCDCGKLQRGHRIAYHSNGSCGSAVANFTQSDRRLHHCPACTSLSLGASYRWFPAEKERHVLYAQ